MMNKKIIFALLIGVTILIAEADVVSEVQTRIAQVMSDLPRRRKHVEMLWNYDIVFATNAAYQALSAMVSNDWRNVLKNLNRCASNQYERLLILGVRDRFGADFYMDFMDELVTMKTNGVVTAKEFSWAGSPKDPELEKYLERKYRLPRVRTLIGRLKVAEPENTYWDDVLSGIAYTNYLEEVSAGLWGVNPPGEDETPQIP